ncbi:MAG: precorrin-3B C(17)-methyltransferase [Methanoregulaceae archaeon]|nr:precorrin-3B C(17)-methyltransferase [Methanoregulaceae archaeon]
MPSRGEGVLYVVGTGPGIPQQMTGRAIQAISDSDCVIGNAQYLDAIRELLAGKQVIRSAMGREIDRARQAVELARDRRVSLVSGGDPGVYGMAALVIEVLEQEKSPVKLEIVPGVTAANAAASCIGSPLSGDFIVLSLSDLLTPMEVIEERLDAAFAMGIPVVLYNPKSKGRPHHFARALEIALRHLPPGTPVAVVRNAYREGEEHVVSTLSEALLLDDLVDMHSTVFIGGKESRVCTLFGGARGIVTPRGYHRKYVY